MEKTRIPAAQSSEFASWSLPDVESGQVVDNAVAPSPRSPSERIVARALTAGQLEDITAQAQREGFVQGVKEGRAAGFSQGLEAGRAAAQSELAQQVRDLRAVMQKLFDPLAEQSQAIETAMTQLALDIARSVLNREPALAAEQLIPLVRRAVRELPVGERNITVVLNPKQLELIREHADWPPNWHLQGDNRLDSGGCKITTEHSLVDYSVEMRFRQIAAQMLAESAEAELPEPGTLLDDRDV